MTSIDISRFGATLSCTQGVLSVQPAGNVLVGVALVLVLVLAFDVVLTVDMIFEVVLAVVVILVVLLAVEDLADCYRTSS